MKIYQPVKPFRVVQQFGENRACVLIEDGKTVIECNGDKPPKGYRSLYGVGGHKGIDIPANHGQPVYCGLAGTVSMIDTVERTGLDVKVESVVDGETYLTVYEHLLGYQPKIGDKVEVGSLIGWADNTGWSSGDHLHFELKQKIKKDWKSIDPMPFMQNQYAKDVTVGNSVKETVANTLDSITESLRKPPFTSVEYEEALKNLEKSGLKGVVLSLAKLVLRQKYMVK